MDEYFTMISGFNIFSVVLRMITAVAVGGILGLEREKHRQAAGIRTYMIVCVGAASAVLLSQYLNLMLNTRWAAEAAAIGIKTDVSRFGAQVVNGIGFLGAGAILVERNNNIKGLTTAASLWAAACVGLAVGAGFYECVLCASVLMLVSLEIIPKIENLFKNKTAVMTLYIEYDTIKDIGRLMQFIKQNGVEIDDIEYEDHPNRPHPSIDVEIRFPRSVDHRAIIDSVSALDYVCSVREM